MCVAWSIGHVVNEEFRCVANFLELIQNDHITHIFMVL